MSIYIAARDLSGLPIGTHQFLIIEVQSNPHPAAKLNSINIYPKMLDKGKMGYVVGAQNRENLEVEYFEKSDYEAALEFYNKQKIKWYKSDYDTQVLPVKYPTINKQVAMRKIFEMIDAYHINQTMDRISYPKAGIGFNSNSWAQTVIELSGGIVKSNMKGLDISNNKRIPKIYFTPVCLPKPRPKIN